MDIAGGRFVITGGASLIGSHVAEQLPAFRVILDVGDSGVSVRSRHAGINLTAKAADNPVLVPVVTKLVWHDPSV